MKIHIPFYSAAALLLLLVGCAENDTRGKLHPLVGKPLTGVTLIPLTGDGSPLNDQALRGRVVLINVWATWCPPCKLEFPHLSALAAEYADRSDFLLASVSTGNGDYESTQAETTGFLTQQASRLRTWYDPEGQTDNVLTKQFGLEGVPKTVVLDRTGVVRGIRAGYLRGDEKDMQALVKQLLDAKQ